MLQVNNLIGFGVGGGVENISLFASDNTLSALPANIALGDVILIFIDEDVLPSGYTSIVSFTSFSKVAYKIASGNEGGNAVPGSVAGVALVFRANQPITQVSINDLASQFTGGGSNPASQTVNASTGTAPLVVIGCYNAFFTGGVSPRTFNPAKDGEVEYTDPGSPPFNDWWLAYKIYNSSQQDTSVDMDADGDFNFLASFYMTFS